MNQIFWVNLFKQNTNPYPLFKFGIIIFLVGFFFSFVVSCGDDSQSQNEEGYFKVIGVSDGDTFKVLDVRTNTQEKVRLFGIDCPEKKQKFGQKSKNYSSDMCFGKNVSLRFKRKDGSTRDANRDQYGRMVCEIILPNGVSLNEEILRNGFGWHYKEYSNDPKWAALEENARAARIGLWSEPPYQAPWDWRKNSKKNKNKNMIF